jgi:ubiquinone/menaquinone biosynthesis C-methylase UbiE
MARKKASGRPIRLEFLLLPAEDQLPLPDASIDTVVTWTLCSITDVSRALQQVNRILKVGGHLIFVEHGLSPDPSVALWQERIAPFWKRIGSGCHLNHKIDELIRESGFRISALRTDYLRGPRPMSYTYQGFAEKDVTCAAV